MGASGPAVAAVIEDLSEAAGPAAAVEAVAAGADDVAAPPAAADGAGETARVTAEHRLAGERERVLAAAREEGLAVGRQEGRRQAYEESRQAAAAVLAEAEALLKEARALRREAVEVRSRALDEVREEIVRLAVEMARRILRRELSLQPEEIVRMVAGLLAEAREQDEMDLLVSPGDAVLLEGQKEDLLAGLRSTQRVRIVPDPSVAAGGAVLETPGGTWDARVESQLKALETALREAIPGGD